MQEPERASLEDFEAFADYSTSQYIEGENEYPTQDIKVDILELAIPDHVQAMIRTGKTDDIPHKSNSDVAWAIAKELIKADYDINVFAALCKDTEIGFGKLAQKKHGRQRNWIARTWNKAKAEIETEKMQSEEILSWEEYEALELLKIKFPERQDIITNMISPGDLIYMVAREKFNKSVIAMNMAIQLANGEGGNFLNQERFRFPDRPVKTLYFQAEFGKEEFQKRLAMMCQVMKPQKGYLISYSNTLVDLSQEKDLRSIVNEIEAKRAEVVILDPLFKFYRQDISKYEHAIKLASKLLWLRKIFPGIVIFIPHHIRKMQRDGRDDDFAATWGSFALTADANVIIRLAGTSRNNRRTVKARFLFQHQPDAPDVTIKRNDDTLWMEIDPESDDSEILKPMLAVVKQYPSTPITKLGEILNDTYGHAGRWGTRQIDRMADLGMVVKTEGHKRTKYVNVIQSGL